MKRLALLCFAGAFAVTASAKTAFPHFEDNYDISDPAAWGGSIPTDQVNFNDKSAVYTLSRDVTFASVQQQESAQQDLRFVGHPYYMITVAGSFNDYYGKTAKVFDGGKWSIVTLNVGNAGNARADNSLVLTNGVHVTAGTCNLGYTGIRTRLKILNNSYLQVNGRAELVTDKMLDAYVEISDGGKYTWTDGYFQPAGNSCTNCVFLVSGAGSVASNAAANAGYKIFDSYCVGNLLRIEKGGVMDLRGGATSAAGAVGFRMGSYSNRIEVVGAGSRFRNTGLQFSPNTDSWGNSFLAADGALVDLTANSQDLVLSGAGRHEVVISNATLKCKEFTIGKRPGTVTGVESEGNALRLIGQQAKIEQTGSSNTLFGHCGFNEVVFDNANYDIPNLYFGNSSHEGSNNTMRVVNGSALTLGRIIVGQHVGRADNCALYVTGGSTLTLTNNTSNYQDVLKLCGANARVILSNATITATGKSQIYIGCPYEAADTGLCTNDILVVQGANPKITGADCRLKFANQAVLRFEMPEEGYSARPFDLGELNMDADTRIEIECDAFQRSLRQQTSIVLARVASASGIRVADAVAAANEKLLPLRRQLLVDGTDLVLRMRPNRTGFCVIVR